ncbi:hypothetical protein Pmani_001526 [Petrolisthes manimaculis]|uniref:Uncharacterized protein n=1 Tax=Petrolisthes manimaculis TaxID=1843537 RepID=A0AAE1UK82_9EUCA|nr:hypothetical protein Pmani_001526 [Petrolisthes manimaculis]
MDDDSFFELLSRFQSKQMDDQRSTLSLDNHRESNNTAAPINTEKRSRPLMERSNSSQMEHKPPTSATTATRWLSLLHWSHQWHFHTL